MFADEIDAIQLAADRTCSGITHSCTCAASSPIRTCRPWWSAGRKPILRLVSLMDHTPGTANGATSPICAPSCSAPAERRGDRERDRRAHRARPALRRRNWPLVVEMFRDSGIVLASHDDTTEGQVVEAAASGCTISEFPTTRRPREGAPARLKTIGGAPTRARRSHSGGVAMRDLVAEGCSTASPRLCARQPPAGGQPPGARCRPRLHPPSRW